MLACARATRCRCSFSAASSWNLSNRSSFNTSAACRQEDTTYAKGSLSTRKGHRPQENSPATFEVWLNDQGMRFKRATTRNWLGGSVPFSLNPSFKPPTPVSDAVKSHIYQQYMDDPSLNSVRSLATKYGMSIKRVDAILRLKGLEEHWQKGKTLQTGFAAGMESLLGVDQSPRLTAKNILGADATESDLQDETEVNDRLRDRYVRSFWEPVAEGTEPVMPGVLERARLAGQKYNQAVEDAKSDPRILGRHAHNPPKVQLVASGSAPGRPTTKFVDAGGRFIDLKEHTRRSKESERRRTIREKNLRSTTKSAVRTLPYLKEID